MQLLRFGVLLGDPSKISPLFLFAFIFLNKEPKTALLQLQLISTAYKLNVNRLILVVILSYDNFVNSSLNCCLPLRANIFFCSSLFSIFKIAL